MIKLVISAMFFVVILSLEGQVLMDTDAFNPNLKSRPGYNTAFYHDEHLYLGGNIAFVNSEITSPFIRIDGSGQVDQDFARRLTYTSNLSSELHLRKTFIWDRFPVVSGGTLSLINMDGSKDGFDLANSDYPYDFMEYKDSLLVISGLNNLTLYDESGSFRQISTGLESQYSYVKLYALDSHSFLLCVQDIVSGEYFLYKFEDFAMNQGFTPLKINNPGYISKFQILDNSQIFLVGPYLEVNDISGSGLFLVNSDGSFSEKSLHTLDLSSISIDKNRIITALLLDNGSVFVVTNDYQNEGIEYKLHRLLSNGVRDDLFIAKTMRGNDYVSFFMVSDENGSIFLVGSFNTYEEHKVSGVVKIDQNGIVDSNFQIDIDGLANVYSAVPIEDQGLMLVGDFYSSHHSEVPYITTMPLSNSFNNSWIDGIELSEGDLIGRAKVLANGDVIIGAYDRDDPEVLKVYDGSGNRKSLPELSVNIIHVTSPVNDIIETDDYIYVIGTFNYSIGDNSYNHILKLDKNYHLVDEFNPALGFGEFGEILGGFVTSGDQLIVNYANPYDPVVSEIIKLKPDGSKDDTFSTIQTGDTHYINSMLYANDTMMMVSINEYNEPSRIALYDLSGNVINNSLFETDDYNYVRQVDVLNDSIFIFSGSFNQINSINKKSFAIVGLKGEIYDDISLDIDEDLSAFHIQGDTLFLFGPGAVNGVKGSGFYAVDLTTEEVSFDSLLVSEDGNIELFWTGKKSIREYVITRTDGDDSVIIDRKPKGDGFYSFSDDSVKPNVPYKYYLISRNILGSNSTNEIINIVKPNAPSNVALSYENGSVLVQWTDNSTNEESFEIYRKVDDLDFELIGESHQNQESYIDEEIELEHTLTYYVRARSSNFNSDSSQAESIQLYKPKSPDGLNVSFDYRTREMRMEWASNVELVESYVIYESSSSTTFEELDELPGDQLSYTYSIQEDGFFQYYLIASNKFGSSEPSEIMEVSTILLNSQDNLSFIYPNPTSDYFVVNANNIDEILVSDMTGRVIVDVRSHRSKELVQIEKPGVYLVQLKLNGELLHKQRLIVK